MLKHLTTMKLLFWFRKSEAKDQYTGDPVGTIQCRININNNLLQIGSTGVECKKSAWDSENQIVRGSMPSTKKKQQAAERYFIRALQDI